MTCERCGHELTANDATAYTGYARMHIDAQCIANLRTDLADQIFASSTLQAMYDTQHADLEAERGRSWNLCARLVDAAEAMDALSTFTEHVRREAIERAARAEAALRGA